MKNWHDTNLTVHANGQAIVIPEPELFIHPDPAASRGQLKSLTVPMQWKFGILPRMIISVAPQNSAPGDYGRVIGQQILN